MGKIISLKEHSEEKRRKLAQEFRALSDDLVDSTPNDTELGAKIRKLSKD